jgi:flagellar biosynthesis regulator FlaF
LFPSTKTKSKSLLDPEYVNTHGTRLKDTRGCWLAVMQDLGLEGAKKMLRKSFISMSKVVLKDSFKVMFLSGHTKEATIDIHYNKSTDDQQKEYANEVSDKVFNFNKN